MEREQEIEYLGRRADEEWVYADTSPNERVAYVHRQMAVMYESKADRLRCLSPREIIEQMLMPQPSTSFR